MYVSQTANCHLNPTYGINIPESCPIDSALLSVEFSGRGCRAGSVELGVVDPVAGPKFKKSVKKSSVGSDGRSAGSGSTDMEGDAPALCT